MIEQYSRKVQDHGTGKEIRIPPEICEELGITDGGEIQFDLEPGDNIVTLRKAGTLDNRQSKEQPKPITVLHGDYICIISGKLGSGKTRLAEILCQNCKRLIIYDTLGKHRDGVVFLSLHKLKDFCKRIHHDNFRLIHQPLNPESDFDSICKIVTEYKQLTFLVENLDWYYKPHISQAFEKIIENGCHQIQLIGTTMQRPDQINKRLINRTKQILELTFLAERTNIGAPDPG